MEYKFNKHYLQSLIKDSKSKYKDGIIRKHDYDLLTDTINNLIYGDKRTFSNTRINNIDIIKIKLNILKENLGMDNIENILNIAEEFLRNSSKQKVPDDTYKQAEEELIKKVIEFYSSFGDNYAKYISEFINSPYSQLEIISRNIFNKGKYRNAIQIIPIYNLEFIRIVKDNVLYDEAKFCHEMRHEIDIQKLIINSMDLNSLVEVNPIATELFYEINKLKENPKYIAGIIRRMNYLRNVAHQLVAYMNLLIQMDNSNTLNTRMIEETFRTKNKEDLDDILVDLDMGQCYQLISYFIGTLKGMYLCDMATTNLKSSLELQDRLCSILVTDKFIPENIANVLGTEFLLNENDVKVYKKIKDRYL